MKKRARITKEYTVYHLDILDASGEVVGTAVCRADHAEEVYTVENRPIYAATGRTVGLGA